MEREFELFSREKKFVSNVSPNTVDFYERSYKAFKKYSTIKKVEDISKPRLIEFVASTRESGLSAACSDAYIRGINTFLRRLFENESTSAFQSQTGQISKAGDEDFYRCSGKSNFILQAKEFL